MTIVIMMLNLSMFLKIIETIVKMWIDFLYPNKNDARYFKERLGHCYIYCNSLFTMAVGLNLNIWISFYIKIGK